MRLFAKHCAFTFGMPTRRHQCVTVTSEHRAPEPAGTAPREADTAQLRAAEQVGLFPYPDASDRHPMLRQGA